MGGGYVEAVRAAAMWEGGIDQRCTDVKWYDGIESQN